MGRFSDVVRGVISVRHYLKCPAYPRFFIYMNSKSFMISVALCPSYRNVLLYVQILGGWVRVLDVVRAGISVGHFYRMGT